MDVEWNAGWALLAAGAIDVALGELPSRVHPVVALGALIRRAFGDARALERTTMRPRLELLRGALATALVASVGALVGYGVLRLPTLVRAPLEVLLLTSAFAVRSLASAGARMRRALDAEDLPTARDALGWLCSRDARALMPADLAGGATESLAENLSDSVVAPLFWYALLGLPGALAYRAVNTMDAMYGYRDRREWLGKVPARLDDVANLIPARLTALAMLTFGALAGGGAISGVRVMLRDAKTTPSPNAGYPMAAASGLFRARLDKREVYALGAEFDAPDTSTLRRMERLVWLVGLASWLALGLVLAMR